ncbi:MAG: hypothetical protein U1F83_11500 [Verrucomicrobiota bacterium]
MKASLTLLVVAFAILSAQAQSNIFSINVVGYVNHGFASGISLFSNPLEGSTNNNLGSLFSAAVVPNGTTISLWNPTTLSFDSTSTFNSGLWSVNFTLNPGTGARLTAPSAFTNTFIGTVLNHDGTVFDGNDLTTPPVYAGPNGIFLLSDKTPIGSTGDDIFLNILGRAPQTGEQVLTLTTASTYLGGGSWDHIPSLGVSDAVFLNIGPVPEPSVAALGVLGLALLGKRHRQR